VLTVRRYMMSVTIVVEDVLVHCVSLLRVFLQCTQTVEKVK